MTCRRCAWPGGAITHSTSSTRRWPAPGGWPGWAPDEPAAHLLLAVVQGSRRDADASRRAIDTAIRLAPDHSEPYRIAAALDLQRHRATPHTESMARRAVSLAPDDPVAHRVLGSTLIGLRRFDEAAAALGQAAALNPADPVVSSELARIDIAKRRSASAAIGFAAAVRADPTDAVARHNLQAVAWNAFRLAHLVLWLSFLVIGRATVLADSGPTARLAHVVAPLSVLATLGAWAYQLRRRPSGFRVLLVAVRSDRLLSIAMIAHALCLLLLVLAAFVPTDVAGALLIAVTALLVLGTVVGWIRVSQLRKRSARQR